MSGFATYGLPERFSLSGSVGYSILLPNEAASPGGVSANISLIYYFARKAVLTVGVFSGFRETGLTGQDFGLVETQGFTAGLSYIFSPFVTGSLQGGYNRNSPTQNGNTSLQGTSSNLWGSATVNWQIRPWLLMIGRYSYTLYSNPNGSLTGPGSIPVNTVTLSLQATL